MRVLVFVVGIVVVAALSAGGGILIALNTPRGQNSAWLSGIAVSLYLVAPLVLGSLSAFWDTTASPEARRGYRRGLIAAAGVQVLATIIMCAFTAVTGAPWWLTVLFTAVGVAAMAAAVKLGPFVRRFERARPASSAPWIYGRGEFRRDLRNILATIGITLVVSAAVMGILLAMLAPDEFGLLFRWAPLFAVMGGGIACVVVMMRLNRRVRDLVDGDLGRANRIGKVVVCGKAIPLTAEEAELAVPFASLSWVAQAYQAAWFVALIPVLALMQVFSFVDDPSDPWPLWFAAFFIVLLIAVLPVTVIQLRRTRSYALQGDTPAQQDRHG